MFGKAMESVPGSSRDLRSPERPAPHNHVRRCVPIRIWERADRLGARCGHAGRARVPSPIRQAPVRSWPSPHARFEHLSHASPRHPLPPFSPPLQLRRQHVEIVHQLAKEPEHLARVVDRDILDRIEVGPRVPHQPHLVRPVGEGLWQHAP